MRTRFADTAQPFFVIRAIFNVYIIQDAFLIFQSLCIMQMMYQNA